MDQEVERVERPWTDGDVKQLQELARQGLLTPEIAQRMHRSRHSVYGKIRRSGIDIDWKAAKSTVRKHIGALLRAEYEGGASVDELAAGIGKSYGFVHRLLTEAGTTLRRRGGSRSRSRSA